MNLDHRQDHLPLAVHAQQADAEFRPLGTPDRRRHVLQQVAQVRHWLLLPIGLAVLALALAPHGPREEGVSPVTPDGLAARAFDGREFGWRARVPFPLALVPTENPLTWEYRPGVPARLFAPAVRLEFDRPPAFGRGQFSVVEGTVNRIEPDARGRRSGRLGVVVLTGCVVVTPPALP